MSAEEALVRAAREGGCEVIIEGEKYTLTKAATAPQVGDVVTGDNIADLTPGSVVLLGAGTRPFLCLDTGEWQGPSGRPHPSGMFNRYHRLKVVYIP